MGEIVAKLGNRVIGIDTHVVVIEGTPTPLPHVFNGTVTDACAETVYCDGAAVAMVGSVATTNHVPQGGPFQNQPKNRGTVSRGSSGVFVEGKRVSRNGDAVECCNDYADADTGQLIASGTVFAE